ncbi:QueT transporter family protein [Enterococcus saccharolyticus]|uniref:Integral membrane protein n=1 Tax=Enterococcus saccharolyticus subsp. saccharolyticus ATCC 43076 TaxID=1139996 RepID=S0J742_9ENTE|nr:QueT transporter family protein [Enterococcus saccharolyticus]EOT28082.1 integral membrane protein [Enterococcus saccharolyticus subsp. saccharolyticus ATCC 43076]EOT77460.1 integral membrane protein [Enterococcus saccharolyticus subsp. saccharolyticus ATCC 43076]
MSTHRNNKLYLIIVNAIIMGLYVVLSFILPFSSGAIQFRLSESLNHLVVFNRKLMWGVFGGVLVYNLFFGFGIFDVIFGGGQTLLALTLTAFLQNVIKDVKVRMVLNILFFTASMFLIALMLTITLELPFWPTYGTTALSEFIIMTISAPVMYYIDSKLHFAEKV